MTLALLLMFFSRFAGGFKFITMFVFQCWPQPFHPFFRQFIFSLHTVLNYCVGQAREKMEICAAQEVSHICHFWLLLKLSSKKYHNPSCMNQKQSKILKFENYKSWRLLRRDFYFVALSNYVSRFLMNIRMKVWLISYALQQPIHLPFEFATCVFWKFQFFSILFLLIWFEYTQWGHKIRLDQSGKLSNSVS